MQLVSYHAQIAREMLRNVLFVIHKAHSQSYSKITASSSAALDILLSTVNVRNVLHPVPHAMVPLISARPAMVLIRGDFYTLASVMLSALLIPVLFRRMRII